MRPIALLAILLPLLAGACCPITSVHPLPAHGNGGMDDLAGVWRLDSREDRVILHIGRSKQGRWQIVLAEHKADGILEQAAFEVTTAAIGDMHFLDIDLEQVGPSHREGQRGHIILNLALADRYTLHLRRMNLERITEAIRADTLSGELIYDRTAIPAGQAEGSPGQRKVECARITATSADLGQFLAGETSAELFDPYLTFTRIACID